MAGLTQILPVSIPTDSLLVSGLKDIQEHDAGDTKTHKSSGEHSDSTACARYTIFSKYVL